jgi:hypothetical protein
MKVTLKRGGQLRRTDVRLPACRCIIEASSHWKYENQYISLK